MAPPSPRSQASSPAEAWSRLRRLASDLGFYVDHGERWTYTGPPDRLISIPSTLDHTDAVIALAQQLGHVQLPGRRPDPLDGERWDCHGVPRVEADSIAYIVLTHLGLDPARLAFPPVGSWAGTDPRAQPLAAVRSSADRILRAAGRLRKHLDAMPAAEHVDTATTRPPQPAAQQRAEEPASAADTVSADELAEINLAALKFFISQRPGSWVPGYLHSRGFDEDVQTRWLIGHAPKAWQALTNHLRRLGHSDQTILASGLARRGRSGQLYDLFRDRTMVAIRRPDGTIAGFIGRLSPGAKGPKYLNTPQTPLFRKGELLYGLHEVRDQIADGARPVLVEGPFDAIAINIAAPDEYAAMAPSGTALTTAQLEALGRDADLSRTGLILALDGDQAGQAAIERAWDVVSRVTGPVEAALLPNDQDPADILRNQGPAALRTTLRQIVPLADVVLTSVIKRAGGSLHSPEDRMAAVRASAAVIARMAPDQVTHQVAGVARRLQVDHAIVTNALTAAITSANGAGRLAAEDFPPSPLPSGQSAPHPGSGRKPTRPVPRRSTHA